MRKIHFYLMEILKSNMKLKKKLYKCKQSGLKQVSEMSTISLKTHLSPLRQFVHTLLMVSLS